MSRFPTYCCIHIPTTDLAYLVPNTTTTMMMSLRSLLLLGLVALSTVSAFTTPRQPKSVVTTSPSTTTTATFVFNKNKNKKPEMDLSDIEVRDMTRKEMLELNAENERVMNAELVGMTLFSLVLSVPMLYLVWVGFFSETAEMNLDM